MEKTKILIADDHTMFRQTLRKTLQSTKTVNVIGEASSGREVISKCIDMSPDIVLMDLQMPEVSGINAMRILKEKLPEIRIIVLTMHEEDEYIFDALNAGANGYILKSSPLQKLILYIEAIKYGDRVFDSSIADRVMDEFNKIAPGIKRKDSTRLTAREVEVLQCLADGLLPKDIARKLFISLKTVKNHISNIYTKLNCHDRTQAILGGKRMGIIKTKH